MKSNPFRRSALTLLIGSSLLIGCLNSSDDTPPSSPTVADFTADSSYHAKSLSNTAEQLDHHYIPALFYSNIGNNGQEQVKVPSEAVAASTRSALTQLQSQWDLFAAVNPSYASSGKVAEFIKTATEAYQNATQGSVLTTAHPALEAIRDELGQQRASNGIAYFMDRVTEAHHAMEAVSTAAASFAQDPTALATALTANNALANFKAAWGQLVTAYGDGQAVATAYHLSTAKAAALTKLISNTNPDAPGMAQMVAQLEKLVSSRSDDATMTTLASKIKPKFVALFVVFGDFITPFRADMVAMERAYIPALYCSNNPKQSGAPDPLCQKSGDSVQGTIDYLTAYRTAYNTFISHYPVIGTSLDMPKALGWSSYLTAIETHLAQAESNLAAVKSDGKDLTDTRATDAHNELDTIRGEMAELRHDYENYPFVADAVTQYHAVFESLMVEVMQKGVGVKTSLSSDSVAAIKALMPQLMQAFATLKGAVETMDHAEYQTDSTALNSSISQQEANLNALQQEVDRYSSSNDNSGTIASKGEQVRKLFMPLIKALGAF